MSELRPPSSEPRSRSGGWISIGIAASVLMSGGVLLCLLPLGYLGPAIVLGGLFLMLIVGLHYLIWGHWVTRVLEQHREDDSDA